METIKKLREKTGEFFDKIFPDTVKEFRYSPLSSFEGKKHYMDVGIYNVNERDELVSILNKLRSPLNKLGTVVMTDDDGLVKGLIRRIDVVRAFQKHDKKPSSTFYDIQNMTAAEIFELCPSHPNYPHVRIEGTVNDAIFTMKGYGCDSVPVVGTEGEYLGFVNKDGQNGLFQELAKLLNPSL